MSSGTRLSRLLVIGAGMLAAVAVDAQTVVSTGASQSGGRDLRWEVSGNGGSSWTQAFVVTPVPAQWTSGAPGGTWIGATQTGSRGGGAYRVRTLFELAAGDLLSFNLRCAVDNSAAQVFINGAQFGNNACGTSTWRWGGVSSLTAADFLLGTNTLEVRWIGDNQTDGVAVEISALSFTPGSPGMPGVVPEPSTYALLGTGLAGVLALRRRRRVV